KFGSKIIQGVHDSINQEDTINCSFLLKSRFRLAGNDNPLCRVNRPGIAEGFYPVIQMMFKSYAWRKASKGMASKKSPMPSPTGFAEGTMKVTNGGTQGP